MTNHSITEQQALEVFQNEILETAKSNFLNDGELHPMVFIGIGDKDNLTLLVMPAGEFMQNEETKEALSQKMSQISRTCSPVFIGMVMEMWYLAGDHAAEVTKPSLSPYKREGLICLFESENIQKQWMFDIHRDPVHLDPIDTPPGAQFSGKFVNFLKDLKKMRLN